MLASWAWRASSSSRNWLIWVSSSSPLHQRSKPRLFASCAMPLNPGRPTMRRQRPRRLPPSQPRGRQRRPLWPRNPRQQRRPPQQQLLLRPHLRPQPRPSPRRPLRPGQPSSPKPRRHKLRRLPRPHRVRQPPSPAHGRATTRSGPRRRHDRATTRSGRRRRHDRATTLTVEQPRQRVAVESPERPGLTPA